MPSSFPEVPSFGNQGQNVFGDESVRQLNSLLRGELSATETYRKAIDKVEDSDQVAMDNLAVLREIEAEHEFACNLLRDRVVELGGQPSDSPGAWGVWAKTIQGVSNLFGDTAAIKSLKEGEEHGLKDYQDALDNLDPASQQIVAQQFIPGQQRHISLLNQIMSATDRS